MAQIVNLTAHSITVRAGSGDVVIPPSGTVARVEVETSARAATPTQFGIVPVVTERYGSVVGLPPAELGDAVDAAPGILYVVSRTVQESCPDRTDLLVPTDYVRDAAGQIVAAGALCRIETVGARSPDPSAVVPSSSPPTHLVLLCGSNPLPALLSIRTRRPASVTLVHSPETEPVAKRLRAALRSMGRGTTVTLLPLASATDSGEIRRRLAAIDGPWALDYTGGTKVMAAQARLQCAAATEHSDQWCSYIDHRDDVLRFDDGAEQVLDDGGLTLSGLALLHGSSLVLDGGRSRPSAEWIRGAGGDLIRAASVPDFDTRRTDYSTTLAKRLRALPSAGWADELRARPGLWLEWFVEDRVHAAMTGIEVEVAVGPRLAPTGADDAAELDVVVRSGWHTTVFSCDTTLAARWSAAHKAKAIETGARARQLAGDAGRPVFVSLLSTAGVRAVQRHLPVDAPGIEPLVVGVDHLRAWAAGDLVGLRAVICGDRP